MSDDNERARTGVEQRRDKAQRTNDDAKATIAAEVAARNTKTARLREQRLAKEEVDREAAAVEAVEKAKAVKAAARAKARAKSKKVAKAKPTRRAPQPKTEA